MLKYIDLSHTLEDGMKAYPGLPDAKIGAVVTHDESRARYDNKAEFYLGKVEFPCNLGTYLDTPFHRYKDRADLAGVPLERLAGLPGVVFEAPVSTRVALDFDCDDAALEGRAVLVRTGWDERWGTPAYWEPGPYLASSFLDRLIRAKAALVGVDFWNVDNTEDPSRPAHSRLLDAGILIVEHMANLSPLPANGFRFYAVPPRIVRGASFPVRAFAEVEI